MLRPKNTAALRAVWYLFETKAVLQPASSGGVR